MGYLDANLSALEGLLGHRPHLPENEGRTQVVAAGSVPVLYLSTPPSQPIALNSRRDPVAEALKALDATLAGQAAPRVVAVIGLGLGFVIDAIEQRCPDATIVALEPEPACVRPLLERRDFTGAIAARRLILLWGPDYQGSVAACRFLEGDDEAVPTLVHPVLVRQAPEAFKAAGSVLQRMRQGARANAEARRKFAPRYLLNTLRNLPALAGSADVRRLFDAFTGLPGLIISAGPSLDRNLDEIRSVANKAILVAVDTALRPLLCAGIRPHLVVAVDPSDLNGQHLQNLPDTDGIFLVAEGSLAPDAFAAFEGRTFTFRVADHHPWPWLRSEGFDRDVLQAWGSVATTAFDLVLRLGCNPVVFVGQDLAFTDGRHHCLGTTFGSSVTAPIESETTVGETDVNGVPAVTTPTLVAFRDWLVEQCARRPDRRFVNATGAGILVGRGITQGSLCGTIDARVACVPQSVLPRLSQGGRTEASQVQRSAGRLVQAMEEEGGPAAVAAAWLDAAGGALCAEEIRSAFSWVPGEARYFARLVSAATSALSRVLALDQPASRLLPAPDSQSASDADAVLARFEWAPAARADVEFIRRVVRIASSREAPNSKETPAVPFRWSAAPSCRPAQGHVPDAGLPFSGEAAGWWARRALLVEWGRLLREMADDDAGSGREMALHLGDWIAAVSESSPVAQDEASTQLIIRLQADGKAGDSFRFDLNAAPWRVMRPLTGLVVRASSARGPRRPAVTAGEEVQADPFAFPIPGAGARLHVDLQIEPALLNCAPDPRARFFHSPRTWLRPRLLELPDSFLCGSLDATRALVTPYLENRSLAISPDGTATWQPAWPRPIVGEQRGATASVAWSSAGAGYLMRRSTDRGAVETTTCPFRPGRTVVADDGTSYWSATGGGLWRWPLDGEPTCVATTRPLAGLAFGPGATIWLDPLPVDVTGRPQRQLARTGWTWDAESGELRERELEDIGQASHCSKCGGWTAVAYPVSDTVRLSHDGRPSFDIACEWPNALAWAGSSLLVTTAYGKVFLFERLREWLDDAR